MTEQETVAYEASRVWHMYASYDEPTGEFRNVGQTERYVQMCGHTAVGVEVVTSETGLHWGWLPAGADKPRLIQHRKSLYLMQFPYGPEVEEEGERGQTLQLLITRLDT